ncbi:MAG: cysteine desulfurase [Actinomycetota bacterium]|nr:cysteine desulfurase [Actinomycetota bacterium]
MTYFDHAATTPMRPEALAAMTEQFGRVGNASSLHAAGRDARRTLEEARERLATALGAEPYDVLFTSGGTEADNLAVKGIAWARRASDPRRRLIAVSAVEHHAVLDAVAWLVRKQGFVAEVLPVDSTGRVDERAVAALLDTRADEVALLAVMWANNEVGTLQPIAALSALARAHGVPFHTDAVQAVGAVPIDLSAVAVDSLALAGHKLGGPPGVGALILRRQVPCTPLLHGGGQERDVRSGTYDVPSIVALSVAVEAAVRGLGGESARITALRDDLVRRVTEAVPGVTRNGGDESLPGNAHLTFADCDGDALLMLLDAAGIECATGAACAAGIAEPSHVLLAMGRTVAEARGSLRFSLGHTTTGADVDALIDALPAAVHRAREVRRVATARRAG